MDIPTNHDFVDRLAERAVPNMGGEDGKLRLLAFVASPSDSHGYYTQEFWYDRDPPQATIVTKKNEYQHDFETGLGQTITHHVNQEDRPLEQTLFDAVWARATELREQ